MKLPVPFYDELLLSRMIRYVTLNGMSSCNFCKLVTGSNRASIHPYLPSGLKMMEKVFDEGAIGLINTQTLAPIFFTFQPNNSASLEALMLGNEGAKTVRASQLLLFKYKPKLGLKYCPKCATEDLLDYGVTYWHRSHQMPGIIACGKHFVFLNQVELVGRQRVVPGLLPPSNENIIIASKCYGEVAKLFEDLLNYICVNQCRVNFAENYRAKLFREGYITKAGSIRQKRLTRDFMCGWVSEEKYLEEALPKSCDYHYFAQLLDPSANLHPIKHVLFIYWLYRTAKSFFSGTAITKKKNSEKVLECSQEKNLRSCCLSLLRQGDSMAEVSRLTGKSRCFLKRLAILNNIKLNLKPRIITKELIYEIIKLARLGFHRCVIADKFNISTGSVEQVISSVPELVNWRKKCHFESSRRRNRCRLLRYKKQDRTLIRDNFKVNCNQEYFWLYNNDRAWLEQALPEAIKSSGRWKGSNS